MNLVEEIHSRQCGRLHSPKYKVLIVHWLLQAQHLAILIELPLAVACVLYWPDLPHHYIEPPGSQEPPASSNGA